MKLSYQIDMDESSVWMMVTAGAPAKASLPYVQELGDFIAHEKYFTMREGLPSYLIKYTLAGEGILEYGGSAAPVPAGHFLWIDCEKPQQYYTSKHTGEWRVLWVHFYGATCRHCYEQFLSASNGRNTGTLPGDNSVSQSIYALMDLYREKTGAASDIRAAALLAGIMAECVSAAAQQQESSASRYVREARDYILSHHASKISLDQLAKHVALNKYYLQKLYRQQTGQTPYEYMAALRLNTAKELLRATEKPIRQIAEEIGIYNVSHFIKQFKASEGITPNGYRRRWRLRQG